MSVQKKLEQKIYKKEQDIKNLETQIREAKAYIQALQDFLKLLPRDGSSSNTPLIREGSQAAIARDILGKAGGPLRINDILKRSGKEITKKNRQTLSGTLAAYYRKREIFTRPSPGTYGLVEFRTVNNDSEDNEPPEDFGSE